MKAKEEFMRAAIGIAVESAKNRDYAVGAVVVKGNEIIAAGKTTLKHEKDPTSHAEVNAIRNACKKLDSFYLEECILYSTHEPCPMCAAAAVWAKMKGIVFGAFQEDAAPKGKKFSWRQISIPCREVLAKGEPKLELAEGFLREECIKLFDLAK